LARAAGRYIRPNDLTRAGVHQRGCLAPTVQAAALALEAFLDEAPEQGLPALFPLLGKLIDLGEQTLVYINEDTEQIARRMILRASRH